MSRGRVEEEQVDEAINSRARKPPHETTWKKRVQRYIPASDSHYYAIRDYVIMPLLVGE